MEMGGGNAFGRGRECLRCCLVVGMRWNGTIPSHQFQCLVEKQRNRSVAEKIIF